MKNIILSVKGMPHSPGRHVLNSLKKKKKMKDKKQILHFPGLMSY
jgi:hypothetical protein